MKTQTIRTCENCKKVFSIAVTDVKRGRGRFCGKSCAASGRNNNSYKHGHSARQAMTKEYRTWAGVIKRTTNPNATNFKWYGGRGISVSPEWLNSFEIFFADVGKAPTDKHELDRIDNQGNYEKGNCRWVTHMENMHNRG